MSPVGGTARQPTRRIPAGFEAGSRISAGSGPDQGRIPNQIPDPSQNHPRSTPAPDPDPDVDPDLMAFEFGCISLIADALGF